MDSSDKLPVLYTQLAEWWPVLSDPTEYAEEAEFYRNVLLTTAEGPLRTMLELGSGGGNNASYLKRHFTMTLVDLAPGMLEVSRRLNPECEHVVGDMRTVRLERQYDAILIQDAVSYMCSETDLERALETAAVHCRTGGVVLLTPDQVRDRFTGSTSHGGNDAGRRGLRYLEWTYDPDPADTEYVSEMVYLMRNEAGVVRREHDRHVCGLFDIATWLRLMEAAGFEARATPFVHSEPQPGNAPVFVGRRR